MRSPFPGMDPYLEQHWRDIHHSLITYARDGLQARLPNDLRARVEERVYVGPEEGPDRSIYPDLLVVERGLKGSTPAASAAGAAVAEPLVIHGEPEPATEGFIEIIDIGSGRRVVTVIEVLSLSNKWPGPGQDLYRKKQNELKQGKVSLVEIDLLRDGDRVTAVPPERVPRSHRTTYHVCVRRGSLSSTWEVYRVPLRDPLPTIHVPLRETDADVPLELQALIDQCYANGRYDDIDYKADPRPPLDAEDAAWADELLRGKGLRG